MQRVIDLCMADVLLDDERYRFTSVPRFLALKQHEEMGRRNIELLHGHTWASLEAVLDKRFPPYIWHPRHWPADFGIHDPVMPAAMPKASQHDPDATPLALRIPNTGKQVRPSKAAPAPTQPTLF